MENKKILADYRIDLMDGDMLAMETSRDHEALLAEIFNAINSAQNEYDIAFRMKQIVAAVTEECIENEEAALEAFKQREEAEAWFSGLTKVKI